MPRLRRPLATLLLALSVVTCSDSPSGPGTARRVTLALVPRFTADARRALDVLAGPAFDIQIDRVRVVIVRPPSETLCDTTILFPADQDQIAVSIPLTALPGETLSADLSYQVGDTLVLFHGHVDVVVQPPGGGAPPPDIPIVFIGPGATATQLLIAPSTGTFSSLAPVQFTHQVFAGTASISGVPVEWATSDSSIANIGRTGVLQFTGKRGPVDVVAHIPTPLTTRVTVTFLPPLSQLVVVSGGGQTGAAGATLAAPFVVEARATDGVAVAGQTVTFSASNGSVAPTSVVTGADGRAQTTMTLGPAAGVATFSATLGTLTASVTATAFSAAPATLAIAPRGGTLTAFGASLPLAASVRDANGNPVTDATVTWTSRSPDVATVNSGGTVIAAGNGTARIVATAGAASDSVLVTVSQTVDTVLMSRDTLRLRVAGDTGTIRATPLDRNRNVVTNVTPTYTSSDVTVATVDQSGFVTLQGDGTTIITASAGGKQGTAVVISLNGSVPVGVGYASLRVTPANSSMRVGDTVTYSAVLVNADGSTAPVNPSWATNSPGRAPIDANGRLIAVDTATVTVTATSAGVAGHASLVILPAPVLRDFSFAPTSVSGTATTAASVVVSATLDDAGSGISSMQAVFTAPDNTTRSCTAFGPSTGTRASGTWSCNISIPAGAPTGSWHATGLTAVGTITRTYNESALSAFGPTTLTVNP